MEENKIPELTLEPTAAATAVPELTLETAIPFVFVFLAEAMYLFLWLDNIENWFK